MRRLWMFFLILFPLSAFGQNLSPDLQKWTLDGSQKKLSPAKKEGEVFGTGQDSHHWRSPALSLQQSDSYLFRFQAKGKGSGGCIISGLECINRDFRLQQNPSEYSFGFRIPTGQKEHFLRLGQWHLRGKVSFKGPELYPVQVIHRKWGKITLGEGESLKGGKYRDSHILSWQGSTIHRTLKSFDASFNTNRWAFYQGSFVVYRHSLPMILKDGKVSLNINYYRKGALSLLVSGDGKNWQPLATSRGEVPVELKLPKNLFPSPAIYIKLKAMGDSNFQVNSYSFEGSVDYSGTFLRGETHLVEERQKSPEVDCRWEIFDGGWKVRWKNRTFRSLILTIETKVGGKWVREKSPMDKISQEKIIPFSLPNQPAGKAEVELVLREGKTTLYRGRVQSPVGILQESQYGYFLASSSSLSLWWCEGPWKVGRKRLPPERGTLAPLKVELAKGEFEPVQLVLRPREKTILQKVKIKNLKNKKGRSFSGKIRFFEVAYLPVEHPSDLSSLPGDYPDPLPPLKLPLELSKEKNQPLWLLVQTTKKTLAGLYEGTVEVMTDRDRVEIPLKIRVFNFTLPKTSHLRSGFGIDPHILRRYHHLKNRQQERVLWDLYMKNFRDHRISPYTFAPFSPIQIRFVKRKGKKEVVLDFRDFDHKARRYLDEFGFNSFRLRLRGMGWGTFHSRHKGSFGGAIEGTPEYDRLFGEYLQKLEGYLKKRGWLDKGYVYWFDEPEARDYPFVIQGMKRIRKYAPAMRRLLTEQPEPELYGHVEIWCGLTPHWTKEMVEERKKAGEEVWWYICTGPKSPYIGLFIDHPAAVMRLWPWQSWQYGVQGILIWQTTYWTSSAAFPRSLQNPWDDPMGYVSGYSTPKGSRKFWGNGDGRFLYPPRRDPNSKYPPLITAPISSLRWENLRDGMEDYEYFYLLRKLIEKNSGKAPKGLIERARKLLKIPPTISKDLTNFTRDPRPMMDHRQKVAEMIEKLGGK